MLAKKVRLNYRKKHHKPKRMIGLTKRYASDGFFVGKVVEREDTTSSHSKDARWIAPIYGSRKQRDGTE